MKRVLVFVIAFGVGCQTLTPLGGGAIRVADGRLDPEEWFALPDGQEFVAARDPDGMLHLIGFDGSRCPLGDGRVRAVVGRGRGADRLEVGIVLTAPDRLEVRNLSCELRAPQLPQVLQVTMAFEDEGSFAMVVLDRDGMLWRLDVLDGHREVVGASAGRFGVRDQTFGHILYRVQWTEGGDGGRPQLWTLDDGQVVVSYLGGPEIDRAGDGVLGLRGFDPMWLWDAEGLKRWTPGGGPAELVVPEGCAPEGINPLYVRAPCARGDLLALDVATDVTAVVAHDVVEHQHFAAGDWLSYVTEADGTARRVLLATDGETRQVPLDARPLASHAGQWLLRVGTTIVRLGPDGGAPEELLTHLHAAPTILSDGRWLLVYGEPGEPPVLAAFDPSVLRLDILATGAPAGDVRLAVASLTGRSVLFYRSGVEDGVGVLEAMLWPEGPQVMVADGVTAYRPALTAQPPALLYATGGDDPALWLVPI